MLARNKVGSLVIVDDADRLKAQALLQALVAGAAVVGLQDAVAADGLLNRGDDVIIGLDLRPCVLLDRNGVLVTGEILEDLGVMREPGELELGTVGAYPADAVAQPVRVARVAVRGYLLIDAVKDLEILAREVNEQRFLENRNKREILEPAAAGHDERVRKILPHVIYPPLY